MKLNCLIVDDEPLAHNVIIEYAKDVDYLSITGQAYLPTVAMQLLKDQTIDLIFLDIQMPRLNGLEMLRLIEDKPEVIITSAYEEYALQSYELQVCDYLLKPFRFDRFLQATEKALQNHQLRSKPLAAQSDKLLIKVDKKLMNVSSDEIIYIESELSIAEICYDSGYNNLSYFNRKFKEILGVKPSEFRDKYK